MVKRWASQKRLRTLNSISMNKSVVVIGGGIAGMTTAGALSELGFEVVLIEKEDQTGGHVRNWDRLFPSRRPGKEVIDFIGKNMGPGVEIQCGTTVSSIDKNPDGFTIHTGKCKMQSANSKTQTADSEMLTADGIVLATGYELFDARKKEEYGYGIYDNVITSAELEAMFKEGKKITTHDGKIPKRVGIIHCVGSRDEKVGNLYCSKVCCVTGVKQAIEIREMLPGCEVFSFYMDLRMYDRNFEELYYEAQQKWGVNFIRGRLSECAENPDHSLLLKTEDTLTGRPLKMTVDLVVLLVGFVPRPETRKISQMLGLQSGPDGFLLSADEHVQDNSTSVPGVFLAGAVKGPACIVNSIADARATALQVKTYLNGKM
jgi:heterodisulfide reductase subunit A2